MPAKSLSEKCIAVMCRATPPDILSGAARALFISPAHSLGLDQRLSGERAQKELWFSEVL